MKLKTFATCSWLLFSAVLSAQTNPLIINPAIALPKDSIESLQLISSLNELLLAAQKPNEENTHVLASEKTETYILLDEINGIEASKKYKDEHFFKPYLTNVVPLKDKKYLLTISYIGVSEQQPLLRASFELIANKTTNTFLYSSPLKRNTRDWKTDHHGTYQFHYKTTINKANTLAYEKAAALYDKKLSLVNKTTEIYCCEDLDELLKLIGVVYKLDYNGKMENTFSSIANDKVLIVTGTNNAHFDNFDPHDLWHERLGLAVPRKKVNRPVDEACAYSYGGGSWGLTWKDVYKMFNEKVAVNKNTDWKALKETPFNFSTDPDKYLMADYVVNALIVQKLEKEKGFAAVWELLNCGSFEKGNEKYYKVLEKLTGITKENYNEKVWELINNENKRNI